MMIRNLKLFFALLVALLMYPAIEQSVWAQASGPHAAIEKYLDSQTLGVAWIDISKIDVDELMDFGQQLENGNRSTPNTPPNQIQQEQLAKLKAMQQALLQNKVTRIYGIVEFGTIDKSPNLIVIPTTNAASVSELLKSFVGGNAAAALIVQDGQAVIAGQQALIDAVKKKEGEPAAALLAALAGSGGPHGLAAVTPIPLTSTLLASPKIQSWVGNDLPLASALGEALVSLKSVSLQTELPPTQTRLHVETQSAEAARKAADLAKESLEAHLPEMAQQLAISTEGAQLTLQTDSLERSLAVYKALSQALGQPVRATHVNNMKQIALALHNYVDTHGRMPPQSLTDKSGKRLLSWRVLILPYLEQTPLYQQFHLDEPWDSAHNLKLAQSIPSVYSDLSPQTTPPRTRIVAPLTADSPFGRPGEPMYFNDVTDGLSNTVWLLQADPSRAVVWTKPEDITIDVANPTSAILDAQHPSDRILVGMMDGSVQTLAVEPLKKWLVAMLSTQGGEIVPAEEFK